MLSKNVLKIKIKEKNEKIDQYKLKNFLKI